MSKVRIALVAGVFATASLVAGVSAPAGAAHVAPTTRDVSMANLAANERELNIVVDPNNPNHLAAGANERGGGNSQEWYTSTNGGRTWTSGNLPFGTLTVTDVGGDGDTLLMSDPALDFGAGGRIYYSALAHRDSEDPCTLFVTTSTDDGTNWSDAANGVIATGGTSPVVCNDKEFILVDRGSENVYAAWTPFGGGNNREVVFSRDLNGAPDGLAFSAPIVLSTDAAQNGCLNHGAELAQETDGDLYVAWTTLCNGTGDGDDSSIWVARSTNDGVSFGAPVQVATLDNVNPALATGFRSRSFPSIDADATTGRAFVVWADYTDADGGDADILMSSAIDNAGWTAAQDVDQETDNGDDQFMPWVDVGQGRVHVAFYSFDEETSNHNVVVSYGNVAATPTLTAVQVNSQPTPGATGFLGDYIGIDVGSDNVAHAAWGDGRAGVGGATDAWTTRLDFSPPASVAGAASPPNPFWGSSTTVTATVTGAHGEAEQFIPVQFSVSTTGTPSLTTGSGTTNASGQATFTYSNGTAGSDTVNIWADLDEDTTQDSGETTAVVVTWRKHPTVAAYTGPTVGEYHDPLTVSGTLRDAQSLAPLAGKTLTLGFGTDTCTGVTDVTGTATCGFTPQQVPGPYTAEASFAGDSQYDSTTSPGVGFTLNKEQTQLSYTGPAFAANGDPVTLSGLLTEDDPTPVAGRTVSFTLGTGVGAQSCSGVTNASGVASCTIAVVNQPNGANSLVANFAGDAYYLSSSDAATVVVFTWTAGGNFVIGDGNASTGTTATFWSSNWSVLNTVSGGAAPTSFKGFANNPPGKTTCGGTWSTSGGNSPPPASALPSYTAVLVTSLVTKSGAVITGSKPHIAVVRVNPGYGPNPGHPGTAEVLGLYC